MNLDKEYFKQFTDEATFERLIDFNNVVELLDHVKKEFGSCKAAAKPNGSIASYNDLYKDVNIIASSLKKYKAKNIGLVCNGNYQFEIASLAIMATGNCAVLIPCSLDDKTISALIDKFDLELVVCDKANANKIKTKVKSVCIDELLLVKTNKDNLNRSIKNTDSACILLTSGTTGKSKGVVLSHEALMTGTINGCYGLEKVFNQTYYCMIPLTNSFGLIRNMLCAIYTGSMLYFNTDKILIFRELTVYKPTVLILVPALAELFLNIVNNAGIGALGGKVHTIICGSANVPPYLPHQYEKLGIKFCPGYGLTEFANIVTGNPVSSSKSSSVGLLFPNQEAMIVDGELWLKGRNMFKQYYKDPQETKKAIFKGWFRTGDLARFDEDYHIYITGRIKNLIVFATGEKVSPEYIESKINELDLIQDSMVYLNKNEFGIESIWAEVTIRPAILAQLKLLPNEVSDYIQNHINKINKKLLVYQQIKKIIIRDKDFERNQSMKIIRKHQ